MNGQNRHNIERGHDMPVLTFGELGRPFKSRSTVVRDSAFKRSTVPGVTRTPRRLASSAPWPRGYTAHSEPPETDGLHLRVDVGRNPG